MNSTIQTPHVMIRASAGSGKTYQLTNRYMQLLLDGQDSKRIFASTFTRKAAGEILAGVLTRLSEAVLYSAKFEELCTALERPGMTQKQLTDVLMNVARGIHRDTISTIDGFFVGLAKAFYAEMHAPTEWNAVDEPGMRKLRLEAIGRVIREDVQRAVQLVRGMKNRKYASDVAVKLVDEIEPWYDVFRTTQPQAWLSGLDRDKRAGGRTKEELMEHLRQLGARLEKKGMRKALDDNLTALGADDWKGILDKGIFSSVLKGNSDYARSPIPEELIDGIKDLLSCIGNELREQLERMNQSRYEFLSRFDSYYRQLQHEHGLFSFLDIAHLLGEYHITDTTDSLNEVFFRLDSKIDHVLLDEFQDTSVAQWRVLQKIVEEVVADGTGNRSFLVVGDVKQAIYGWRGGVSDIFEAIGNDIKGLREVPLNRSYRSSKVVIDAVNQVFSNLDSNSALESSNAAKRWQKRFEEHETALDLEGYVRLHTADRLPEKGRKERAEGEEGQVVEIDPALEKGAKLAAEWAKRCPGATIALLTQTNESVRVLIDVLEQLGVKASEEGGNPITDSAPIMLVLSLLSLADHPYDSVSRFHVANSCLGAHYGLEDNPISAATVARRVREELVLLGYPKLITQLAAALAPHCDAQQARRLSQLLQIACKAEGCSVLRASEFVEFVQKQRVEAPDAGRVRVMTIYKAKGLQFDVVVLADLTSHLSKGRASLLVRKSKHDPMAPPTLVLPPLLKAQAALVPEVQDLMDNWREQQEREALCLLYVAMTRAIHCLEMVVMPGPYKDGLMPTYQSVLYRAFGGNDNLPLNYELGNPNWDESVPRLRGEPGKAAQPTELKPIAFAASKGPPRGLTRKRPSSLLDDSLLLDDPLLQDDIEDSGSVGTGHQTAELKSVLRISPKDRMRFGSMMHRLFETITWLENGVLSQDEMLELAVETGAKREEAPGLLVEFERILGKPEVKKMLSEQTYSEAGVRLKVHRELPFALRFEDQLVVGAVDRVVVRYREGVAVGAEVIDYKTDALQDDKLPEDRMEQYERQVKAYCVAVSRVFRVAREQVKGWLLFVTAGKAKQVV